jgi:hypothetical protein
VQVARQLGDTADMIRVGVRGEDRGERQALARQGVEDRRGIIRVRDDALAGTRCPDVVVIEGA